MDKLSILENAHRRLGSGKSGNWGHAGRPGKRGGSLARSVAMSIRTGKAAVQGRKEDQVSRYASTNGIGQVDQKQMYQVENYWDTHDPNDPDVNWDMMYDGGEHDKALSKMLHDGASADLPDFYRMTSSEKILGMKAKVAEELAEETGVSLQKIHNQQEFWIDPSSAGNVVFQKTVADTLGAHTPQYTKDQMAKYTKEGKIAAGELIDSSHQGEGMYANIRLPKGMGSMSAPERAQVVQAIYDRTQSDVKEALGGRQYVRLYRGTKAPSVVGGKKGDQIDIETSPISAWTPSPSVARMFGDMGGAVIAADISVERLFSTPYTGLGELSMGEILVLSAPGDIVEIYDVP